MIVLLRPWNGLPVGFVNTVIGRGAAAELVRRGIARWSEDFENEDAKKCTQSQAPRSKSQVSQRRSR